MNSLFDTPTRNTIAPRSKRDKHRQTIEKTVQMYLYRDESMCGDDPHKLTIELMRDKFGIVFDREHIIAMASIDRARRKILTKYPQMDKRVKMKKLEKEDKEYYGENK